MGEYDEEPHETGHMLHEWAESGIVNILGGCCGTTPDHIRHVAEAVARPAAPPAAGAPPRHAPGRAGTVRAGR